MSVLLVTGIDIEEIDRIRQISPAIRERFIRRVLTPAERSLSDLPDEHIVGLFCAKEAVAKALGCGIGLISWQEIEVSKDAMQRPFVRLSGQALARAEALGYTSWSLSISHTMAYAVASVVGYGER